MIRPLTIATCLLACGSGLYLYQSKHEVQLLDRTIERTVGDTNALREQSRRLATEWTMLNDPERLRQFSDTYLKLKSITPTQFTSLADLDARLPEPQTAVPPQDTSPAPVVVEEAPQADPETAADDVVSTAPGPAGAAVAEELPVPPIPAAPAPPRAPAAVAVTRPPVETKAPERMAMVRPFSIDNSVRPPPPVPVAEARPSELRPAPRVAEAHVDVRAPAAAPPPPRPIVLAAPRPYTAPVITAAPVAEAPTPARQPMVAAVPYTGSLLGMARGAMPPAPRPTPVNATYNSN